MYLTALPVFNEAAHVSDVLDEVVRHAEHVLVIDDGSTDGTSDLLKARRDVRVVRHPTNRGYGAALATAFEETIAGPWEGVLTIDCDGQHQPRLIPDFIGVARDPSIGAAIVSGSRFLDPKSSHGDAPADRRRINVEITAEINASLGLAITDAFCGFKAYTRRAVQSLHVTETGYAMPLQVWVQAAAAGLKVVELPVPLVYLDPARGFGGALDDAATRLAYYRSVLRQSIDAERIRVAPCHHSAAPTAPLRNREDG